MFKRTYILHNTKLLISKADSTYHEKGMRNEAADSFGLAVPNIALFIAISIQYIAYTYIEVGII